MSTNGSLHWTAAFSSVETPGTDKMLRRLKGEHPTDDCQKSTKRTTTVLCVLKDTIETLIQATYTKPAKYIY